MLFVIFVFRVFYINNFQVIIIGSLYDVGTEIKPAEGILIGFHEDKLVSFDNDVKFIADTFLDLIGFLFSEEDKWMYEIKGSLGLVEHLE